MSSKTLKAYSLLEMVVVLGVFSVISVFMMPSMVTELQGGRLNRNTFDISSQMYTQQMYAYGQYQDTSYGVAFFTDHITYYEGDSLATATTTDDFYLDDQTAVSEINLSNSATEITFSLGDFRPSEYGTVTLSNATDNYQILINQEGLIEVAKL
jgi:type II secretory pathway pseudopilin PulG